MPFDLEAALSAAEASDVRDTPPVPPPTRSPLSPDDLVAPRRRPERIHGEYPVCPCCHKRPATHLYRIVEPDTECFVNREPVPALLQEACTRACARELHFGPAGSTRLERGTLVEEIR